MSNTSFLHTQLCIGVDPHQNLLAQWGLTDNADGLKYFSQIVVDAVSDFKDVCIKPQLALFERHGSKGIAVLEDVLSTKNHNSLVIMDAKRGDIGSTMRGYADAFVKKDSPLRGDGVTISPYLGVGSIDEFCSTAIKNDCSVFVLCLTSNPQAYDLQHAYIEETKNGEIVKTTVAKNVFDYAYNKNLQIINDSHNNSSRIGLVVGATIQRGAIEAGIDLTEFNGPILSPGVGAQGAGLDQIKDVFGICKNDVTSVKMRNVIPSLSRSVLSKGPNIKKLKDAISQCLDEYNCNLNADIL